MANTNEARPPDAVIWSDVPPPPPRCQRCGLLKSEHVPINFNENLPRLLCPTALWQDPIAKDTGGAARRTT